MNNKICKQCNIDKIIDEFRHQNRHDKIYISGTCKKCDYKNGELRYKKFMQNNIDKERIRRREYYKKNKERIKEKIKDKKPEWDKRYYIKNKKKIRALQVRKQKEKRASDPSFRIRKNISKSIWRALKASNSSKFGKSCLYYLSYTIQELKDHLESKFEKWMNWSNYGIFISSNWDDHNESTWTWQIDHIIPQSMLPYTSMEDDNFKKCWSLDNLRPLSAKQNNFDGTNRTRHTKVK